jgi:hypothetical protein
LLVSAKSAGHQERKNVREWETGDTANLVNGVEDTELGALGMTKVILPVIHGLGSVQHGTRDVQLASAIRFLETMIAYPS